MGQEQVISTYQPILHAIAVRMLGCVEDAEDIVNDTFLKWLTVDTSNIANTKAYLIKAVTNNCLNHLEVLKRKKDELIDNLSPADLIEKYKEAEILKFDVENEVSEALNILHRKLEPVERAVYILREAFNFEYDELQVILDKKKDNCRQLLCRAKEKLSNETIHLNVDTQRHLSTLKSFRKACHWGHFTDLITELSEDVKERLKNRK